MEFGIDSNAHSLAFDGGIAFCARKQNSAFKVDLGRTAAMLIIDSACRVRDTTVTR